MTPALGSAPAHLISGYATAVKYHSSHNIVCSYVMDL